MSTTSVTSSAENTGHELPTMQLAPVMTDDDVAHWNDLLYFHQVLDDIENQRIDSGNPVDPFPPELTNTLDIALELVRGDYPDRVGPQIARWRTDLAVVFGEALAGVGA